MTGRRKYRARRWRDLSGPQKALTGVLGLAELVLTTVAARDLAKRDAAQVRGPKALWAPLLAVQPVGSIAYLLLGRRGTFSSGGGEPARQATGH